MARATPEATAQVSDLHRASLGRTRHAVVGAARTRTLYALRLTLVGGLYVVSAKAGLSLSVAHGSATPVWAPTGIALAALILFGPEMWPAIAAGAFAANVTSPIPVAAALGITVGNTAEALIGYLLLRRVGFRPSLDRVRDVVALVGAAAIASTAVSATVGVTTSLLAGTIVISSLAQHWLIWWVGDMMGDLLVAPFLLVWIGSPLPRLKGRRLEAAALAVLLAGGCAFVFTADRWVYAYLLFPLLLWATLRFSQHGATVAILTVAGIALARMLGGSAPLGVTNLTTAVEAFQALLGIVGVSLLILAATISERARAEAMLLDRTRLEEQTRRALAREHEALEKLKELDDLKTTFLHAVSHDLRTPLASILGLAVTLARHDLELQPEDAHDLADRIVRNARRLDRLVNDLLDYERLDRGQLGARRAPTDVGALVQAVIKDIDPRGHPLHVSAESFVAEVDAAKVERIVDNLVTNAIRHTPDGTEIWLGLDHEGKDVLLTVEDSGPGVPAAEREAIFAPFVRSPSEPSSPGTGIGLSLVAKFAELHGGRAWVQEREGGGAAFRVLLSTR